MTWGGRSLDKINSASGTNYSLVLPSWSGKVYPTIVYEAMREGIEDSRIIRALKDAIVSVAEVGNSNYLSIAEDATAYLYGDNGIFTRPSREYGTRYKQPRTIADHPEKYADRSEEMLIDLCNNEDESYSYGIFDEIRLQMIEYILQLQDSDGDGYNDLVDNCPYYYTESPVIDLDGNNIGDMCQIADGISTDCNDNGIPDDYEMTLDPSLDCNGNGDFDGCESVIVYVDENAGDGGDGTTWASAYTKLSEALDNFPVGEVGEIRVAAGTYYPDTTNLGDPRDAAFQMINCVTIYGGYPSGGGERDLHQHETILSGDINGDNTDNCYHVFYHDDIGLNESAVLDGFIVEKGYSDDDNDWRYVLGGGMFNRSCSPTVRNCVFRDNYAENSGWWHLQFVKYSKYHKLRIP